MATQWAARECRISARETVPASCHDTLPEVGDLVADKYRVERLIGRGSVGVVFAARHELLEKRVALKLLSEEAASTPEAVRRFYKEARAAAQIESDHVARVLDVGQTGGGFPFMALELLDGVDLAKLLEERGPMLASEIVGWVLQALEALAEAHSLGIVHRDLKPANLFLARRRDGTHTLKILDFGISKSPAAVGAATTLTVTSSILGSPVYMAPEQLRDAKSVDPRADIWAIGVVLYELLTGRLPFVAANIADLCVAILERSPPPVCARRGRTSRRGSRTSCGGACRETSTSVSMMRWHSPKPSRPSRRRGPSRRSSASAAFCRLPARRRKTTARGLEGRATVAGRSWLRRSASSRSLRRLWSPRALQRVGSPGCGIEHHLRRSPSPPDGCGAAAVVPGPERATTERRW
jgi:serine/threonine protein kinase